MSDQETSRTPPENDVESEGVEDSDEDDEHLDQMPLTEEDLKFIAEEDEEDEDEDENQLFQKKRRRRNIVMEDMDEDDIALIEENTGIKIAPTEKKSFKRIKRRDDQGKSDSKRNVDLENLFEEEGGNYDDGIDQYSADELDDFIEYDDDEMNQEERKEIRAQKMREMRHKSREIGDSLGISQDAWRDVQEIFGDGTEYDYALIDESEEQEEAPEHAQIVSLDEEIKLKDIPERMQKEYKTNEYSIEEESVWIANQLQKQSTNRTHKESPEQSIKAVASVLRLLKEQYFEVPFIGTHRKELFSNVLEYEELWFIYDLDERWRLLEGHNSEQDLQDSQEYVMLRDFKRGGHLLDRDLFVNAVQGGISLDIGLSPSNYAENLEHNYKMHEPTPITSYAEELVAPMITEVFPSVSKVLEAAKYRSAMELAHDPAVRKSLGALLQRECSVSVIPTAKGKREIDLFHEMANIKYLTAKPAHRFRDVEFCQLLWAEKSGDITIEISVTVGDQIRRDLIAFFLSDSDSSMAEHWNRHRQDILSIALDQVIYPWLKKRCRERLEQEALQSLAWKCQLTLEHKLMVAPWKARADLEFYSSVLAISQGDGLPGTAVMGAYLNEHGIVVDTCKFSFGDTKILTDFIETRHPQAIVISGWSLQARAVFSAVTVVVEDVFNRDSSHDQIFVTWLEDDLAKVASQTEHYNAEFPEYSQLLRYCVSLGRRFQDPLVEWTGLMPHRDILSVSFHPWQKLLPNDLFFKYMERAFINVVNLVGVDINQALKYDHVFPLLGFVCGLGPKKALMLKKKLSQLEKRSQLISQEILGKRVFLNCCAFLKIQEKFLTGDHELDILDTTRIHCENYDYARRMAADALDIEDVVDENHPSQHVEEAMANPSCLDSLLLEEFAKELLEKKQVSKLITLQNIKEELTFPYLEKRFTFEAPNQNVIFTMLTGDTDVSLQPGMHCPMTLVKITDKGLITRMDSGVSGFIPFRLLSDDGQQSRDTVTFQPQQTILCRIMSVQKDRFQVEASCRLSDLKEKLPLFPVALDEFFDFERQQNDMDEEDSRARQKLSRMTARFIAHPNFRNISRQKAEEALIGAIIGDAIIRPSSKGCDHLVITWKVDQGIIQHVEITEKDKENDMTLGKSLWIGKERFDDLDEILTRFIDPQADYVREIMRNPKFMVANTVTVLECLKKEKQKDSKRIPYHFCSSRDYPGKFLLCYQPASKPKQEYVTVTRNGFRFRQQFHETLDELILWFKKHYRDPVPAYRPETPVEDTKETKNTFSTQQSWNKINFQGGGRRDRGNRHEQNSQRNEHWNESHQMAKWNEQATQDWNNGTQQWGQPTTQDWNSGSHQQWNEPTQQQWNEPAQQQWSQPETQDWNNESQQWSEPATQKFSEPSWNSQQSWNEPHSQQWNDRPQRPNFNNRGRGRGGRGRGRGDYRRDNGDYKRNSRSNDWNSRPNSDNWNPPTQESSSGGWNVPQDNSSSWAAPQDSSSGWNVPQDNSTSWAAPQDSSSGWNAPTQDNSASWGASQESSSGWNDTAKESASGESSGWGAPPQQNASSWSANQDTSVQNDPNALQQSGNGSIVNNNQRNEEGEVAEN